MLHLNKVVLKLFLSIIAFSIPYFSYSQLVVDNSLTPQQLIEDVFLGGGVTVSNVSVTAIDGRQIASFTNSNSNLGISNGVMMSTGYCDEMAIPGVNSDGGFTSASNDFFCSEGLCGPGDIDLENLGGAGTNDAAVIEFDFVPIADTVSFRYVFASDEYNEYVCSNFNDIFAFFLNGVTVPLAQTNIATIPNTNIPVAINSLNNGTVGNNGTANNCSGANGSLAYSAFFVDNTNGSFIEFDGMTTILEAKSEVVPCETYHIKLAIADVFDNSFDSGVFLEAASFSSSSLTVSTVTPSGDENVNEACDDATITFSIDAPATAPFNIPLTVTGTATNGIDYAALPSSVTIPTGQTSVSIQINPVNDGLGEGVETVIIEVPTSACGTETVSLNIFEEIVAPPQNLTCTSTTNSITFTWDNAAGNSGWEISLDGGNTWINPNPGPTTHIVNGLSSGDVITIMVRAIGACDPSSISSTTCSIDCNITPPNISANITTLDCINTSALLDAGAGYAAYLWSNSSITQTTSVNNAGTYTVTITDNIGCTASNTIVITNNNTSPTANIQSPNIVLDCNNPIAILDASSSTGQGTLSYLWSTTQTDAIISVTSSGTYTITITDNANGCTATSSITISQVTDVPVVNITSSATELNCNTTTISLNASGSTGQGSLNYEWNTTSTNASINIVNPGTFTVTITDGTGCTSSSSVTISENTIPPSAVISSSAPQLSCITSNITLDASSSTTQGGVNYQWSTNANTASITISLAGTYTVTITDTGNGCTASTSVTINEENIPVENEALLTCDSCADLCLTSLNPSNISNYNITLNGTTVAPSEFSECDSETITAYSYFALPGNGLQGPYELLAWTINGNSYSGTFNNVQELTNIMNQSDPAGNWTLDTGAFLIQGGNLSNMYGQMSIQSLIVPSVPSILPPNTASAAPGMEFCVPLGNHQVIITDLATGCPIQIIDVEVSANSAVPPINISIDNDILCLGGNNGQLSVPSNSDYDYIWSNNENTPTISNLAAGTYTVTITDTASGCTASSSANLGSNNMVVVALSSSAPDLTCDISSILLDASGSTGQGILSYEWSTSSSNSSINIVNPNTFTVTVTDESGCTASSSITITDNTDAPTSEIISSSLTLDCNTPSINLDASTSIGIGTLSYEWSNNATTGATNITNSGTYTVTITDSVNGCTSSTSVVILENTIAPTADIQSANTVIDCNNPTVTLDASGSTGQGTLSYEWSNNETTANIIASTAGTYTVTITDGDNGCSSTFSIVVSQGGDAPIVNIVASETEFSCSTSSINLDASGSTGQGVLSYEWSTSSTNASINIVNPNTFTVTVTDEQGCTSSGEITISTDSSVPNVIITPSSSEFNCIFDNIILDASSSTGTGPLLSYQWQDGSTTNNISINQPGTYTVTITDNNGCSSNSSITIGENLTEPVADITSNAGTVLNCEVTSIILDATGSSGQGALDYVWSQGSTTSTITIVTPGKYRVTITDSANGCTAFTEIEITEDTVPPVLDLTSTGSILDCNVTSININAGNSTGQGALEYQWNNGSGSTNPFITVTNAGTYTVTITDPVNSCTATGFVNVEQDTLSPDIEIEATDSVLNCNVSSITLEAVGFLAPSFVSYLWNDNSTAASIDITSPGTYSVTVTQNINGCTSSASITIEENLISPVAEINANLGTILNCNTPSILLDASGSTGQDTLDYVWSEGSTTSSIIIVNPGTYTVIVTDTNGCSSSAEIEITESNAAPNVSLTTTGTTLDCNTNSININAANSTGEGTLAYAWNNNNGSTNPFITVTNPGTYTVTITDTFNGCTAVGSVIIDQDPALPSIEIEATNPLFDCNTSNITLNIVGLSDSNSVSYLWNDNSTTSSIDINNAGTYTVTITQPSNNCTASASITIEENLTPPTAEIVPDMGTVLNCNTPSILLDATSSIGQGMLNYIWSDGSTTASITIVNPGTYTVTVMDTNGCTDSTSVEITENNAIPTANLTTTGMTLNCDTTSININASNSTGEGTLEYLWSNNNGSTNPFITVTNPGTYTVTITDTSNGCTATTDVTVIEDLSTPDLSLIASAPAFDCLNDTITIEAVISGMSGASYEWNTGETTDSIVVNTSGEYSVIATDSITGCTDTASITLTNVAELVVSITGDTTICIGQSTTLDASMTDITSYEWSNGEMTSSITVDELGTYTVTISDGTCTATAMVTVIETIIAMPEIIGNNTICEGDETTLDAGDGYASYVWSDSNNSTSQSITVSEEGTYTVTISNDEGCTSSNNFTIGFAPSPSYSIIPDTSICDGKEILLGLVQAQGTSYSWTANPPDPSLDNPNIGTPDVSPTQTTTYTLVATNGACTITDSVTVTVGDAMIEAVGGDICAGETATIFATGSPSGGTYLWIDEDGNEVGTGDNVDVNPAFTTSYQVSYTVGDCIANTTVVVDVVSDPNISIVSSEGTEIAIGSETTLTVENAPEGSTYVWTSNNGETSEDESVVINPLENVSYTVEITTPEGCVFFAEINITTITLDIAIPNLFTPNGDELNDRFYIINAEFLYEILEFQVFDRWGEMVHNAPNIPWDGTFKGKRMPSDIYIYTFRIRDQNGDEISLKGDVALMR